MSMAAVTIRSKTRRLTVRWAHIDFYTVTERSLKLVDRRRQCWICGGALALGDRVTVAATERGNKTLHSRCYRAQAGGEE